MTSSQRCDACKLEACFEPCIIVFEDSSKLSTPEHVCSQCPVCKCIFCLKHCGLRAIRSIRHTWVRSAILEAGYHDEMFVYCCPFDVDVQMGDHDAGIIAASDWLGSETASAAAEASSAQIFGRIAVLLGNGTS